MRRLLLLALLWLAPGEAFGQSSPNWQTGYVPPASEWNALWASKQDTLGFAPLPIGGGTMTGELVLLTGTTSKVPLRIPQGQAPTSPNNGEVWMTSAGLFYRHAGVSVGPLIDGSSASCNGSSFACLGQAQTFTAAQRSAVATLSLSGATATPSFDGAQNFKLTLVHASCPCTMANPSTTLVAGQAGVIEIDQSATGGDTVTWGSEYFAAGGTAAFALSSAANARDFVSYYVADTGTIVISAGALNAIH